MTSSTPTGTAASNSSQAPTRPSVACSDAVSVQPSQPPVARMPPRVTRVATNVSAACCSSPAEASSRTPRPASGSQPFATCGRTNAAAPQAPSNSGSRNPAYPSTRNSPQPRYQPPGPTGEPWSAGGSAGSKTASEISAKPAMARATMPRASRVHRRGSLLRRFRGRAATGLGMVRGLSRSTETVAGIRPPGSWAAPRACAGSGGSRTDAPWCARGRRWPRGPTARPARARRARRSPPRASPPAAPRSP